MGVSMINCHIYNKTSIKIKIKEKGEHMGVELATLWCRKYGNTRAPPSHSLSDVIIAQ
jgi:hypothetical protein